MLFEPPVIKWHWMNPVGSLTLHCLCPFAHCAFRVTGVLLRLVPVTCLIVFLWVEAALSIVAANFFKCHLRDKEVFRVHIVVAFPLLVSDITYFVDRPNFVLPAQSLNVQQLRLLSTVHAQRLAAVLHVAREHA